MGEELKACPNPWCVATLGPIRVTSDDGKGEFRMCFECGVRGPDAPTEAAAIAAWNARAPGWMPIETLPNADTMVLAAVDDGSDRVMIWRASILFAKRQRETSRGPDPEHLQCPATHWMPLPPTPATAHEGRELMGAWTPTLRKACADACEPDRPCHEMRDMDTDEPLTPCADCLRACGFEVPDPLDPAAVVAPLL
jgi:hypothetical protein